MSVWDIKPEDWSELPIELDDFEGFTPEEVIKMRIEVDAMIKERIKPHNQKLDNTIYY